MSTKPGAIQNPLQEQAWPTHLLINELINVHVKSASTLALEWTATAINDIAAEMRSRLPSQVLIDRFMSLKLLATESAAHKLPA